MISTSTGHRVPLSVASAVCGGRRFPDTAAVTVAEGERVRMRVINDETDIATVFSCRD
ncbi:MAG: hypothetical protein Q7V62_14060 [Actinomycetota bacterium]|nr:hypothetical protein [Actinomycetota bacterium]